MTLVQKFTEKYGKNPITLVEEANLKNFGLAKTWGLERLLKEYVDTDDIKLVNDEFIKELVECFAEAKEKFPEGIKAPELVGVNFEIPNQKASIPKSKGTLENFKDIVGKDELRPVMSGVYVAEDGFLVGTDAHKLIKLKTIEYSADKGKIIDLTKYIKSNGKILDFIDGNYPKYEQVIPKDNLKEGGLTTYAFYNLAKSAQEVKRLISNEIFNINIKLKTEEGETEVFAFSYLIMLEALTFAMANGWDFFTLEYSKPTRAVVLNFGDENIALVMPVMTRDRVLGAKTMTPEEIEENYRLGLTNQKSSKPEKAPKKPVTPSAPVSSEPYKKFEGDLEDTTYVHRSKIASITLTNGEVLGTNDVIDGFYRVNKKMEDGGTVDDYVYAGKTKSLGLGQFGAMKSVYKKGDNYYTKDGENYKFFSSSDDLHNKIFFKMEHGGSMYAGGGSIDPIDMQEVEKSALFYTEKGKWSPEPTVEKFEKEIAEYEQTKRSLENNEIKPSRVIGTGHKPQYARALAFRWLEERILIAKRAIEILKARMEGSINADGGSTETITLDKMIERINNNYNGVKASKTYSDNRVEVISPYFNTLQEIKRKEFNNNALLQKYGNTSQYVLYSNSTFPSTNPLPSTYEIGDTVTFNSVLGGTKTGTIISKMGDEGFRVQIGDGFATIKKSAIV